MKNSKVRKLLEKQNRMFVEVLRTATSLSGEPADTLSDVEYYDELCRKAKLEQAIELEEQRISSELEIKVKKQEAYIKKLKQKMKDMDSRLENQEKIMANLLYIEGITYMPVKVEEQKRELKALVKKRYRDFHKKDKYIDSVYKEIE